MQQMPPILSVSELNQVTQSIVEREIGVVYVRGEISNLVTPTSGHMYFLLRMKNLKFAVQCSEISLVQKASFLKTVQK